MIEEYRASKITIEIPKENSEPWVHLTVNKLFKDANGVLINEIPRFDYLSSPLSKVTTNLYSFNDPVLSENLTVSGYGIAKVITSYVTKHLGEHYG